MTPDKVEEWVEENAQIIQAIYHLSGTEVNPTTWESIKIHLRKLFINRHQDMMSEVGRARDQEAKLWFETWLSCYIAPEKPSPGEFAKFATERVQMTGYLREEAQTIIKSLSK